MSQLHKGVLASFVLLLSCQVFAADFPTKPVALVVPYTAGGGSDVISRALAKRLGEIWGQTVTVENLPGADGLIGASRVTRAPADGHTLLISIQAILFFKHLRDDGQDPLKSLTPVSLLAEGPTTLVVSSQLGVSSVADLKRYCADETRKCAWGSGEPFTMLAGTNLLGKLGMSQIQNIRYAGTAPALNNVAGGHLTLAISGLGPVLPHLQAGKVRLLGIASKSRLPDFPDVPTYAELGLGDEFTKTWYGIFTPRGTPPAITQAISDALRTAARDDGVTRALAALKINAVGTTPEEFADRIQQDDQTLRQLLLKTPLK